MRFLTNISCLLVGVLFVFSGFVKAVDPSGFAYKLTEYFLLDEFRFFATDLLIDTSLVQSVLICGFEIFLGFGLIVRHNMKLWSKPLVLMIIFFTFLTGYSWGFDVVKECGCFGNAIPLTAGQSFIKDLILLVFTGLIYFRRKSIIPVIGSSNMLRNFTYLGGVLSLAISVYGLIHLPLVDFRAFKEGAHINDGINDGEPAVIEYFYLMTKGTEEKLIAAAEYGDYSSNGWSMKSYEEKIIKAEKKPSIEDFNIMDEDGNDFTAAILANNNYYFFLICKHIEDAETDGLVKAAELAFGHTGIATIGLTASGITEIEAVKAATGLEFNFYTCDEKVLATFIRSNPGLVLLKGDQVIKKWHYNDIPTAEEIKAIIE